ncbi:unnamed protein product, partial [Laminaria digitata]
DYAQDTINALHEIGKGVVCYISIGTHESWRSDAGEFPTSAIGRKVDGWENERWIDVNNPVVRDIMKARVEVAEGMGCDAIEPDNMMVSSERRTGVSVTRAQQIDYNRWFADEVRSHGMQVCLKNAVEMLDDLEDWFDFALNEECHEWNECDVITPPALLRETAYESNFLLHNKPVFNVEYNLGMTMCNAANDLGLDTIVK